MSTSNTWNCYSCTCTGVRSLVLKRTCTDCLRLLEDSKSEDLWNSNAKERLKDFWPRPLAHLSKGLHPRFRTEPLPHLVTWTVVEVKVTKTQRTILFSKKTLQISLHVRLLMKWSLTAQTSCKHYFGLNPSTPGLCHVIYYQGDKKYPSPMGIHSVKFKKARYFLKFNRFYHKKLL